MRPLLFQLRRSALLQKLQDPRVQVWLMAGFAGLLVIIGHIRAWSPPGQGKNQTSTQAGRLLLAGPRMTWADSFGPAQRMENQRPALVLQAPAPLPSTPVLTKNATPAIQIRPAMEEAASRPWNFLKRPLRQQLAAAPRGPIPLQIRLIWSGDRRGNAALVARHHHESGHHPAAAFVIGNGSRSPDGSVAASSPQLDLSQGLVEITLIGNTNTPTAGQTAALGELLHHLEALTGHLLLPDGASPMPVPLL